jgi:adenylate cyclase
MIACIINTGGTVDKFIGDAIMAHWGAVESSGNPEVDAFNCVRAALMMRACLHCFNKARSGVKKHPAIMIGCAINSGGVVASPIGSDERIVYTVIGETVSLADRIETFNKPFGTEILITEYTWKLVRDHVIAQKMGTITDAGRNVRIFTVINVKDGIEAYRLLQDLKKIPKLDPGICETCVGPDGPHNIDELRALLGLPAPDLSNLNLEEEEKKYHVKAS